VQTQNACTHTKPPAAGARSAASKTAAAGLCPGGGVRRQQPGPRRLHPPACQMRPPLTLRIPTHGHGHFLVDPRLQVGPCNPTKPFIEAQGSALPDRSCPLCQHMSDAVQQQGSSAASCAGPDHTVKPQPGTGSPQHGEGSVTQEMARARRRCGGRKLEDQRSEEESAAQRSVLHHATLGMPGMGVQLKHISP
jgi:hypothetical protein